MKLKRLLAFAVSAAMVIGMFPAFVFAEEVESRPEETAVAETTEETTKETKATEESEETTKATEPSGTEKQEETETPESKETEPSEPSEAPPAETEETESAESSEEPAVPSETVPPLTDSKVRKNSDIASGICGDELTWTLDAQGTLTISGTGEMDTWSNETKRPWKPYLDSIKAVKVMEGVTSIGQCAFIACKNITSVSLPSTLTTIRDNAFQGCVNLPSVSLPDGLEKIGVWTFADCDSLTGITIPNSVTYLGAGAFMVCDRLKDVIINEEFYNSLGYDPFERTNNVVLHFMTTSNEITYIKTNNATDGTGTVKAAGVSSKVTNVIIPAVIVLNSVSYKVTAIDANAFRGNLKITSVSIGSNVAVIGNNAFYGCTNLTKVSGGAKLKTIGNNAFARCRKLSTFVITSKVLYKIGPQAFYKDSKLKTISIKKTTKLTKSGVKKSLKGSSVKTVKVKKSKIKKYKKIFKKTNSGRKVKVKK